MYSTYSMSLLTNSFHVLIAEHDAGEPGEEEDKENKAVEAVEVIDLNSLIL